MQKNWNEVVCTSCGSINDYKIELKSNQRVCTCNGCGKFLGNRPKDNNEYDVKQQRMPFGKYQGEVIYQMTDLNYLRWVKANCKISGGVMAAINFKLQ